MQRAAWAGPRFTRPLLAALYFFRRRVMINRAALIFKYKKPAVQWINEADPINDNPSITLESVNQDRTVYLLREDIAEDPSLLEDWIKMNLDVLFPSELEGWYPDEKLWPKRRDYKLFKKWFEVEFHSVLVDTVGEPIEDDEI